MLNIFKNQPVLEFLLFLLLKRNLENKKMLTDLRAINKVVQLMNSLQSGIPLPSLFT